MGSSLGDGWEAAEATEDLIWSEVLSAYEALRS